MIYADYEYYTGSYMGAVSEEDFPRLAVRASSFLDYYTQGKAASHADLDAVKMCCCALVDKYAVIEAAQGMALSRLAQASVDKQDVKAETVGSYSRTLGTGAESAAAAQNIAESANKLLSEVCTAYLSHTGLLYRGGGCRCTLPTL